MSTVRTFLLVVLAVAGSYGQEGSSRSVAAAAAPSTKARPMSGLVIATAEAEGCKLEVELPKEPAAGSPVCVRARIINKSKLPVEVSWDTSKALPFYIEIKTGGNPVPLTRYGVKKIAPTDPLERRLLNMGSVQGYTLGPSKTDEQDIPNLALYYDLTVPGEYDLAVSNFVRIGEGNAAKKVWLRVKAIRLTISPP